MKITGLTDNQVQQLLASLKNCTRPIPNEVSLIGKIRDETPVVDFSNHIEYKLFRYRSLIQSSRFSLHIRFKETNDILIRVDVNNGTHKNPNGEIISENHMHIYHSHPGLRKDAYAYPLPNEINDLESLFSVLKQFLEYTNTQDYPNE